MLGGGDVGFDDGDLLLPAEARQVITAGLAAIGRPDLAVEIAWPAVGQAKRALPGLRVIMDTNH